ncbi:MAG: YlxR family protein [Clostridia bacterium]|nr:YlxR family protein [Clostridia bacterium]MBO5339300.1 YlxR family protein [Clostridia bacterium]
MEKKVPLRKCLGCMGSFPKKDLVRVVRTPEGEVIIDLNGKKSGRGAYICKSKSCLKKAIKSKRIQSNLEVEIPESVTIELEKELSIADEQ